MALEYQRGSVFIQGKRRKAWYAKYRVWQKDPSTNTFVAKHRTKKIGLKSELTKFAAEESLREIIAAENASAPSLPAEVAAKDLTLEWFVSNRHLPMMTCRETTKKRTEIEIRRYILRQFDRGRDALLRGPEGAGVRPEEPAGYRARHSGRAGRGLPEAVRHAD